jgi:16S rRNA processing protein RimM
VTRDLVTVRPGDLRAVGVVVGAHGLQGALKLHPLSDFPERFQALKTVYLTRGDEIIMQAQVKRVRYAVARIHITLREVTTREAAEALTGVEVCVPDSETWTLPENVYYASDLLGFEAVGDDGTQIGVVRDILAGPQGILEIAQGTQEYLVPFVDDWVGKIDTERRTIEIVNWRRLLSPEIANDH